MEAGVQKGNNSLNFRIREKIISFWCSYEWHLWSGLKLFKRNCKNSIWFGRWELPCLLVPPTWRNTTVKQNFHPLVLPVDKTSARGGRFAWKRGRYSEAGNIQIGTNGKNKTENRFYINKIFPFRSILCLKCLFGLRNSDHCLPLSIPFKFPRSRENMSSECILNWHPTWLTQCYVHFFVLNCSLFGILIMDN